MSKFIPIPLGIVISFFILFSSALAQEEIGTSPTVGEEAGIEEET
jgi:hypothetical protein